MYRSCNYFGDNARVNSHADSRFLYRSHRAIRTGKPPPRSRGVGVVGSVWSRRSHFSVCCWHTHQRGFSCADSLTHRAISSLILAIPFTASVSIRSCSSRRPPRRTRLQI